MYTAGGGAHILYVYILCIYEPCIAIGNGMRMTPAGVVREDNMDHLAQRPSGRLPESVPRASIVFVSGYVTRGHTEPSASHGKEPEANGTTISSPLERWLHCMRAVFQQSFHRIVDEADGVRTLNLADVPAAATLDRQWSKLAGIIAGSALASLVVWHDGDAVAHPQGEIVARARLVAAAQPDTDVWLPPGEEALYHMRFLVRDDDFWGEPMSAVRKTGIRLHSISMHTGVMLMRARAALGMQEVLDQYYNATVSSWGEHALVTHMVKERGLPRDFYGGGEQGPVNWHLLSKYARQTRMVPWLQHDQGTSFGCQTEWLYPVRQPSFVHFSGCSHSASAAAMCHERFCPSSTVPRQRQLQSVGALQDVGLAKDTFGVTALLQRYNAFKAQQLHGTPSTDAQTLQPITLRHQIPQWNRDAVRKHCAESASAATSNSNRRNAAIFCAAVHKGETITTPIWTCSRLPSYHHRRCKWMTLPLPVPIRQLTPSPHRARMPAFSCMTPLPVSSVPVPACSHCEYLLLANTLVPGTQALLAIPESLTCATMLLW